MKRFILSILISALLLLGLSSCNIGGGPDGPDEPGEGGGSASWEDFAFKASVSEEGILSWDFNGKLHVLGDAEVTLFRGGELGLNPQTPMDKVVGGFGLEHITTEHISPLERQLDLTSNGFWVDLPGGVYTVIIQLEVPEIEGGIFTYAYCFEKPDVTEFTIRFVDDADGSIIKTLKLPVGETLTEDMYPELPANGVGYTVEWSEEAPFTPERSLDIRLLYSYINYPITYVYDEDAFTVVYGGSDTYALFPPKNGIYDEFSFHTMFSEEKKFLGWSTEEGGEPMRVLVPDRENPTPITLYLIWEDYTAEELEFYRIFENTLSLTKYTLTDIEHDRLIVVDKAAGYAHRSHPYSDEKECSTELWYGGYFYSLSNKWYCEKEFEEELAEIHETGLKSNFPRRDCATNIVKTADGYEFDIVFANESYHLTVKSNGNYFTAISGDYNKSYINATLTNTAERLEIPTDFEFKVFPRTTVMNVDTDEFISDIYNTYETYEDFLRQFEEDFRSHNYQGKYIYLGIFRDEACTTPLTEDYYEKNKGGRLKLYTRLLDMESYIESLTVTVKIYIDYRLMPSGRSGKALMDTLTLPVTELSGLFTHCKEYEGWGEYGYVWLEGNTVIYDDQRLLFKEGYAHIDYINDTDFLQWLKGELTEPVDGDYTLEARINVDSEDPCHITIDGYGSFYDSANFRPEKWLIEKDGMVPNGYFFDAALTDPVPDGWYFDGDEVTLYCSWARGEIISFTVCDVNGFSETIRTSSATVLYDALWGYWCDSYPLFYDEKCTEFVNYDLQIEDGKTYFVNSRMEKVSFTIVCNGKYYELRGYENTSLDFNKFFWDIPYDEIERDLRNQDLYPDFSEAAMSALIKEGGVYEIEAREVPKYFIYLDDELIESGYINGYAMESFEVRLGALLTKYSTTRTYGKTYSTSGNFKGYTEKHRVSSYLTADLSTLLPYQYCGDPTESLYLYLVGDFFQVNINVANQDGSYTEGSYLLSTEEGQEFTVEEFLRYATDYDFSGGHVIYKNGRPVADIYSEIMTAGTYESKYEPKATVYVNLKDKNGEFSYYDYTVPKGITVREFFEDVMRLENFESYYIYTDFSGDTPISDFDAVIEGYSSFTVKYHLEIRVRSELETGYGRYDSYHQEVIKGTTVRDYLDNIMPHDRYVSYDWADYNIYMNGECINGSLDMALLEGTLRIEKKDVYISIHLEIESGEFVSSEYTAPKDTTLGAFLGSIMRLDNYQSYYIYYGHQDVGGSFSMVMEEGMYEYYISKNQKVFIGISSREYVSNTEYLWDGDLLVLNKGTTVKDAISKFLGLEATSPQYVYTYGPDDYGYTDITSSCGTAAKNDFNYVVSAEPLICLTMTLADDQPHGFELYRKGCTVSDILRYMYGEDSTSHYKVYLKGTLVEDRDAQVESGSFVVSYYWQ